MSEPTCEHIYACAPGAPLLPNRCRWSFRWEDVELRCFHRPQSGGIECGPHLVSRLEAHLIAYYRAALNERTEA